MSAWEETIARPLRALRLGSVRNQILAFAVVATLVPTLVTAVVSYRRGRASVDETVAAGLQAASSEAARELNLWLDERLADLRATAGSYVIGDNLARVRGKDPSQALSRLREYLNSVRERLPDQETLVVLDEHGRVIASGGRVGSLRVPSDGLNALRMGDALIGEAFWDAGAGGAVIVLAVPIRGPDGRFLAALTGKFNLRAVADLLQRLSAADSGDVYLVTDQGRLVVRAHTSSAELLRTRVPDATANALLGSEGETVRYRRGDGREAVAVLRRVPRLHWAAVAELPQVQAGRRLGELRSETALLIVLLLAAVGLLASVLILLIARPLGRLTAAAAKVAAGDLEVELPGGGVGEVGYLTRVFNTVVGRLRERESQAELERLSVTDALTGLYNRRHLMGTLASEVQRARRLRRPFSILLADVDHFKQYNDTHGHQAGDVALARIADILRKTTRGVDCVARYGGEEFLVMLLETTVATAAIVAERIRARVAAEELPGGRVTLSIGVAECPTHGDTPESLIESADAALYQAKDAGRDRVIAAGGREERGAGQPGRRKGERPNPR